MGGKGGESGRGFWGVFWLDDCFLELEIGFGVGAGGGGWVGREGKRLGIGFVLVSIMVREAGLCRFSLLY